MEPLDLRTVRPRSPYVALAGIVYTARAIDKLRAALPGGDLAGFLPTSGFSAIWARATKISLDELRAEIAAAETESQVHGWLDARLDANAIDRARCSERLRAVRTADIPEDWRPVFDALYPAQLRERHPLLFDLLEADDERLYATGAPHHD